MSRYYILIIEESIKAFSIIGHGNECKFTFASKGQLAPFEILDDGDRILGYISNSEKRFAYIFAAQKGASEKECRLIKLFETVSGPTLDSVSEKTKKIIYENENTKSFIPIDEESYSEIIRLMMSSCSKEFDTIASSEDNDETIDFDKVDRKSSGKNILLYGVPGSGKSWTIEHDYCKKDSKVERLVFHPDYTNADFIGQILPVVDKDRQVTYEFTPGPFTIIMRDAYINPQDEYILIIEEINRGNAPAIFGEVFQLLDRAIEKKTEGDIVYQVGTSEYGITHKYMSEYIYHRQDHKVRIPSNLTIIGTMNTSDQNVFTLDTAFQRRWRMRLIENNFDNVRTSLAEAQILDTGCSWRRFCETVNILIIGNKAKMASAEDKRLGVYFVHETDLKFDSKANPSNPDISLLTEYNALLAKERMENISELEEARLKEIRDAVMNISVFPEKVIKYLWDDAFKFNPEALFDTENMDNLEKVIRTFIFNTGRDRFKIFKSTVRDTLFPAQQ